MAVLVEQAGAVLAKVVALPVLQAPQIQAEVEERVQAAQVQTAVQAALAS